MSDSHVEPNNTATPSEASQKAKILAVRDGADGWGVVTFESGTASQAEPCARCPWLVDSPVGAFPPEVFKHSANRAYDLATYQFGCHASPRDAPRTCAAFLLRGATHDLTVRMYGPDVEDVSSDRPLYDSYRDMAIANGVAPDDPDLLPCRDNGIRDLATHRERVPGGLNRQSPGNPDSPGSAPGC